MSMRLLVSRQLFSAFTGCWQQTSGVQVDVTVLPVHRLFSWIVMVASYLSSSYLISASILSNLGAHLIHYLIYGCGLVSS